MEKHNTQCQKIIELCLDGNFHCQNEFRVNYIFSPHKRRVEIEGRKNRNEKAKGKYIFEDRQCIHGWDNQRDYLMKLNPNYILEPSLTSDEILKISMGVMN